MKVNSYTPLKALGLCVLITFASCKQEEEKSENSKKNESFLKFIFLGQLFLHFFCYFYALSLEH